MAASAVAVPASRRRDLYDVIWDVFTSVYLAIAIIVCLAATALVGALVIQPAQTVDPTLISDPASHQNFLDFARQRYGFLAGALAPAWLRDATVGALDAVGLFDVFNAAWFRILLVVLAANVTMCTLERLEPVWRTLQHPLVRRDPLYYLTARDRRALPPVPLAAVREAFAKRRYHVYEARDADGTVYLLGDRNGLARFGTLGTHLALLLLMLSGAVGTLFGMQEDLAIPDGASLPVYPVGTTNNITVRNQGFTATFLPDGMPSDYYSDLVLFRDGREVATQRVRVNDPLRYGDLTFHQSSFGPAADVEVRDAKTGAIIQSEVVRFFDKIDNVPVDLHPLPGRNEQLFVALPPADAPFLAVQILQGDAPLGVGTVQQGETKTIAGYAVTFRGSTQYTVVRVARNSGENLLYLASALFLGGLLSTFYWPRSRLWVRLRPDGAIVTGHSDRTFDLENELDRLAVELPAWTR